MNSAVIGMRLITYCLSLRQFTRSVTVRGLMGYLPKHSIAKGALRLRVIVAMILAVRMLAMYGRDMYRYR